MLEAREIRHSLCFLYEYSLERGLSFVRLRKSIETPLSKFAVYFSLAKKHEALNLHIETSSRIS